MAAFNYIANELKGIRELFKNGGFIGADVNYSYYCVEYKNGESEIIDNFSVEYNGLPQLLSSKIAKIESWMSSGRFGMGRITTKDSIFDYDSDSEYYKNQVRELLNQE